LASHARFIGMGRTPGRLYDLGPYPGMVESHGELTWVRGEVHALGDLESSLALLDRYEGCAPGAGRPALYERCRTAVELESGEMCRCWVYLYRGAVEEQKRIVSGDYCGARSEY
jgi:gamma-glutamylcyclotransferase (GGCT)/AIG2-like uncharacterized protein YtfP